MSRGYSDLPPRCNSSREIIKPDRGAQRTLSIRRLPPKTSAPTARRPEPSDWPSATRLPGAAEVDAQSIGGPLRGKRRLCAAAPGPPVVRRFAAGLVAGARWCGGWVPAHAGDRPGLCATLGPQQRLRLLAGRVDSGMGDGYPGCPGSLPSPPAVGVARCARPRISAGASSVRTLDNSTVSGPAAPAPPSGHRASSNTVRSTCWAR